jgi:hypothetical protein
MAVQSGLCLSTELARAIATRAAARSRLSFMARLVLRCAAKRKRARQKSQPLSGPAYAVGHTPRVYPLRPWADRRGIYRTWASRSRNDTHHSRWCCQEFPARGVRKFLTKPAATTPSATKLRTFAGSAAKFLSELCDRTPSCKETRPSATKLRILQGNGLGYRQLRERGQPAGRQRSAYMK